MEELLNYIEGNYSPEQSTQLNQALMWCGKLVVNYEMNAHYAVINDQSIDNDNKKQLLYNNIREDVIDILTHHYITIMDHDLNLGILLNMVITIDAIGGTVKDDNILKILEGEESPNEKWGHLVNLFTGENLATVVSSVEVLPLLIDHIYKYINNAEDILSNVLDKNELLIKKIYNKLKLINSKYPNTVGVILTKQNIPPFQQLNYYFELLGKYRDSVTDMTVSNIQTQTPNITSIYIHSGELKDNLVPLVNYLFNNPLTQTEVIKNVNIYLKELNNG